MTRRPAARTSPRWLVYLGVLHAGLALLAWRAFAAEPWLLLAAEAALAVSLAVGLALVRRAALPRELLAGAAGLLAEGDFASRLAPAGEPELDALVALFNRMLGSLRDERLRLEERHQLLDRVLAAAPTGLVTLDVSGRVDWANAAASRLLDSLAEELAGTRPEASPRPLLRALAALPDGGSRVVAAGRRRLKASASRFYDRGFPRRFFLLVELTEELHRSEKAAYDRLVRMIAHEVNNSVGAVTSLLASCRRLGAGVADPDDRRRLDDALGVAGDRLARLAHFLDGFAEVVRLPPPDRRPCDVGALVDDILLLVRPDLERRRIAVAWRRREEVAPVALDRNQMEQVLVNALKNAAEAIGEDGAIAVDLHPDRGRPCLTLADTGGGVPQSIRDRLFVPFATTKRDGRGLGLTLVREVLTQHGFDFALETREGEGADFRVWM